MKAIKWFCFLCVFSIFFSNSYGQANNTDKFVVVLDAGHGGKDPGTNGNGFIEKDIALGITKKVGEILEKHADIKVLYTRKKDIFIGLDERAEFANDAYANLFVSVHCNANRSSSPYGSETYVLGLHRNEDNLKVAMRENSVIYLEENYEVTYNGFDPNSPESYIGMTLMQAEYLDQSILLAADVQKNFTDNLKRKNRGVKQAGFLVLRKTYMPSILVETGFLSNDKEGKYLNSAKGQKEMSEAIAQGIINYKNSIDLNIVEMAEITQTTSKTELYEGIVFKVQLAASSRKLDTKPYNFKGLEGVSRSKEGSLYKYYYGGTSDYLKIQEKHRKAKESGFPTSYIVAFREGKKITVTQALKTKIK
ncbi:MAG TPA: N-acetylmuramoyl-L-alanine amidase [Flavobacteriaceae bacterium]|nr:N-acetylmuramoyl-L-alanine amidase [Flavobacteriaceae bacterium]